MNNKFFAIVFISLIDFSTENLNPIKYLYPLLGALVEIRQYNQIF